MNASWQPLVPGALDGLPDEPGVFELGTTVRSVLFVGAAEDQGLRTAVAEAIARGPLSARARCFRWEACADARGRQAGILDEYRRAHGGALPPEQPAVTPALRAVPGVARRSRAGESGTPTPSFSSTRSRVAG